MFWELSGPVTGPVRELSAQLELLGIVGIAQKGAGQGLGPVALARGPGHWEAGQQGQAVEPGEAVGEVVLE